MTGKYSIADPLTPSMDNIGGLDINILSVTSEYAKNDQLAKPSLSILAVPTPGLTVRKEIEMERMFVDPVHEYTMNTQASSSHALKAVAERRKQFWTAARHGRLEAAIAEALSLLDAYPSVLEKDGLFLTEIGCIYYFQGQYAKALQFCDQGRALNEDLTIAYICVGVSGIYLNKEAETLRSLSTAIRLIQEEELGKRTPILSSVFSATRESVEFNQVTAFRRFQRYNDCVASLDTIFEVREISGTIQTDRGVLSLVMALVKWSPPNEARLKAKDLALYAITEHLQTHHAHLLNLAVDCLSLAAPISSEQHYSPATPHTSPALQRAYASLHNFIKGYDMKVQDDKHSRSPPHLLDRVPHSHKPLEVI